MIKSMTGYGIASQENGKVKYTVELKSLNSKFLELNLRLPKTVSDKEFAIRSESSKLLERGKVIITVSVEHVDLTANASDINGELLKKYYQQLKSIATQLGEDKAPLFELSLNMPEVVTSNDDAIDDEEGKIVMEAFYKAVELFNNFRVDEGQVLKADLERRVELILSYLSEVEEKEGSRIPLIRERLNTYLDNAIGKENVDMNRFEQEIVFYIDKLDITEEKVRLSSHCNYFIQALNATDSNGKKLGFISQEMGREINTLGSKANDATIQQIVVRMKEELEKIKEQLLNVL
ncbi:YicC family protein [Sphingobacterium sp. UT-1RO-CII-1]|uniref:YicC/YloC family endoribonuclease n=1 Tax=Sphingobacterium sp. UT-1RO-CII-1 TaxID=2995225 RepID=UPI00227C5695|nr:YicC/YloC family endoribonuclease [Sphingobacterium sp. UT-1RO-CII-1]MCY4778705.1 YicC family protein [Sphingobacterium sp. UT-1RO-CII-1]